MRQRWEVDELIESWTLDPDVVALVANKTGPTRLGFGVLLKFFELEARFPRSIDEVPIEAVDFVGRRMSRVLLKCGGDPSPGRAVLAWFGSPPKTPNREGSP